MNRTLSATATGWVGVRELGEKSVSFKPRKFSVVNVLAFLNITILPGYWRFCIFPFYSDIRELR